MESNYTHALVMLLRSNRSELFYSTIGSAPLLDFIFMFVISPLAFVGVALNAFAFCLLLLVARNKTPRGAKCFHLLHKYLLFYVLNNLVVSILASLAFTTLSPRYFSWFYGTLARLERCLILNTVSPVFLTINRALEILILCQRLANFKRVFKRIGRASWPKTYALIVIVSCLISAPFFRNIKSDAQLATDLQKFFIEDNKTSTFTYCAKDLFYTSKWIGYAKALVTLFRDCLIVIVEFALSVVLIVYLRRFLAAKMQIISTNMYLISTSASSAKKHRFKRTTRTIAQFAVISAVLKLATFIFNVFLSMSFNNLIINQFLVVVLFTVILKPFLTIFVLYKIDRNLRHALRFSRSK